MRALLTALLTSVLLVAAPAAASAGSQNPPKVPTTTKGAKKCGTTKRFGFPIRVYVTKNKRLSCRRAKQVMRRSPMKSYRGWDVFDWTKGGRGGGPGPWSDVWTTKSRGTVVTGIIQTRVVVYQVYPRSFADSGGDGLGDLPGITAKLDHLVWLGVDALWLSPINASPMADGGYDVADYRAVEAAFGTVEDVERLAQEAQRRGIDLLLDIVPCHTSIEHPWFREQPELYVWSPVDGPPNNWRANFGGPAWSEDPHGRGWYLHSFYPEQPDLDWRNPEVAVELAAVLGFWRSKGVAGFRLDALQQLLKDPELRDDPPATAPRLLAGDTDYETLEHTRSSDQPGVAAQLAALRDGAGEDAFLVGEVGLPTTRHAAYLTDLDASFRFELFFADWNAEALAQGIRAGLATERPAWVLSNHDFPRLANRIGRENVAAAALLLLSLPGEVFLFQGDELALGNGPGSPNTSPPYDRAGRDPFRHPMPWTERAPHHGFTTGTPWLDVVLPPGGSVERQRADSASPLSRTRELIELRRTIEGPVKDLVGRDGVLSFRRGRHAIAVNVASAPRPHPHSGQLIYATHDGPGDLLAPGAATNVVLGTR